METFNFCSFKGGVAKSTNSLHLGACLARYHKKKVLLVDFDSQANLSIGLGIGADNLKTMVPVLQGLEDIRNVIQGTSIEGLFVIPANAYLDGIERTPQLGNDPYAHERLRRVLKPLGGDFDFCFVDTPPSLGWLTQSAFFASDHSVVCVIPEAFSIVALRRLKEFFGSIQQYHSIDVFGVILSFWDERGAVNKEFLDVINDSFPGVLFDSKVRRDIAVSRAVLKGQTVLDYANDSRAADDYRALADEFLKRFSLCRPVPENFQCNLSLSKEGVESAF